jgi:hypothetical protein
VESLYRHVFAVLSNSTPYDTLIFPSAFTDPNSLIASVHRDLSVKHEGRDPDELLFKIWISLAISMTGREARKGGIWKR